MATYQIPKGTKTVDGRGNFSHVEPGDILIVPGDRDILILKNLTGTEAAPITVTGQATITTTGWLCIDVQGCCHLRVTGDAGSGERGLVLRGFTNSGLFCRKGSEYVEVDHLEIGPCVGEDAAGIRWINHKADVGAAFVQRGTHIHDCYIHDVSDEGMYVGAAPHHDGVPLEGVRIHDNRLVNIGREGIQLRQAVRDVEVHHNHVEKAGAAPPSAQHPNQSGAGLEAGEATVGKWHSNTVVNCTMGVMLTKVGAVEFFNNVIVKSGYLIDRGGGGVRWLTGGGAKVYNNTIVDGKEWGIRTSDPASGKVFNNLVVDAGLIFKGSIQRKGNVEATLAGAKFVGAGAGNYRLTADSPAVDAGDAGLFPPVDLDGAGRPQGNAPDAGAFEYGGEILPPPPPDDLDAIANALDEQVAELAGLTARLDAIRSALLAQASVTFQAQQDAALIKNRVDELAGKLRELT